MPFVKEPQKHVVILTLYNAPVEVYPHYPAIDLNWMDTNIQGDWSLYIDMDLIVECALIGITDHYHYSFADIRDAVVFRLKY